jgi:hypothetical protein
MIRLTTAETQVKLRTISEKVQKEPTVTWLEAPSLNLPGRNKENHVQPQPLQPNSFPTRAYSFSDTTTMNSVWRPGCSWHPLSFFPGFLPTQVATSHVSSIILPVSLSLSVVPTLAHRTSVKRFVLFQFLNPKKVVGLHELRISPSQSRINVDSNPRSQCSRERKHFMPETARAFRSVLFLSGFNIISDLIPVVLLIRNTLKIIVLISFFFVCPACLSTLNMEAVQFSETLVGLDFYQNTMCHIPEASARDSLSSHGS